jgi:hypothetical protein
LFEHGGVFLDFFFGLGQEREDFGHREDFDDWEKLGGEMRESAGVEPAGTDFGQQIGAEHFAAIGKIDGECYKSGAMLVLDSGEFCGEFGAQNQRKVFCAFVADRLYYEVGEGHGMAAARAFIRLDTRVSRAERSRFSPTE